MGLRGGVVAPLISSARCAALQCPRTSERKHAASFQQNEKTFVLTLLSCVGKLASHPRGGVHEQAGRNSQTGIYLPGPGTTGFRTQEFLAGKSGRVGTARAGGDCISLRGMQSR